MSTELKTETKEVDCPHCKGKIDVEIQRSKPKVVIQEQITETIKETHDHSHEPQPFKDPHKTIAENMPSGVNFTRCKDGNCGHTVIKNAKGLTTEFKQCKNCGDNTNAKKAKICKTCGNKPEDDEWDESDVKIEIEDEEDDE